MCGIIMHNAYFISWKKIVFPQATLAYGKIIMTIYILKGIFI